MKKDSFKELRSRFVVLQNSCSRRKQVYVRGRLSSRSKGTISMKREIMTQTATTATKTITAVMVGSAEQTKRARCSPEPPKLSKNRQDFHEGYPPLTQPRFSSIQRLQFSGDFVIRTPARKNLRAPPHPSFPEMSDVTDLRCSPDPIILRQSLLLQCKITIRTRSKSSSSIDLGVARSIWSYAKTFKGAQTMKCKL